VFEDGLDHGPFATACGMLGQDDPAVILGPRAVMSSLTEIELPSESLPHFVVAADPSLLLMFE